ncbi:CMD domain protein [Microbacterium marinilacus]|uniref:CMD domain protein n=1 Tax=Microbacterium marinilacus TaxID=415209 RepID=A0ABP7B796_9MICO|nr:CMD domain protein [Microbacterium marinilacus]MBY0687580.1 CMD domain protein [Microbacterium marinilacus]
MTTANADIIDLLAGIAPGSRLDALRDQRPQARENAQRSFEALLEPAEPGTFPLGERYAVAAFVARLHGFAQAADFYADLLGDEDSALVAAVEAAAADGASSGPYGVYREEGLAAESSPGAAWAAAEPGLGARLVAALTHAHLLVFRPRESSATAIQALVDAGWSADDIVRLSQLVAFLTFQLRLAWGLRVLADNPAETEGATR